MNKEYYELVNKIKKINTEIEELKKNIYPIRYLITKRGKYFKNDDSIRALNIIKEDLKKQEQVLNGKEIEREKISETLANNCNHPFVINKVCPLCGKWYYEIPKTTSIALEIPASDYTIITMFQTLLFTNIDYTNYCKNDYYDKNDCLNRITEIIKLAIQEEDPLLYFKSAIEELQYDKDIKIRRLKR